MPPWCDFPPADYGSVESMTASLIEALSTAASPANIANERDRGLRRHLPHPCNWLSGPAEEMWVRLAGGDDQVLLVRLPHVLFRQGRATTY
jgi:hypothetical protein